MADPILPNHYRAMAVFQLKTNQPEDRFVNSFVFRDAGGPRTHDDVGLACARALDEMYMKQQPGVNNPLVNLMPDTIASLQYRVYHLGQAPPRTPLVYASLPPFAGSSTDPLPYEVALCVTWHTAHRSRQGRGRTYLGPFTVIHSIKSENHSRPSLQLRSVARAAAHALLTNNEDLELGVLSSISGFRPITGGYVDWAWDTQRRRGTSTQNRESFGTTQGVGGVIART